MTSLRAFWQLLTNAPRAGIAALLLLMILAGLTEGIGILLLVPLLEIINNDGNAQGVTQYLLAAVRHLGLSASAGSLLFVFVGLVALRSSVLYARERSSIRLQHALVDNMRLQCFSALLGVEWRWLTNTRRTDHANLLLSEVTRVGIGLHYGLALLVSMTTLVAYLLAAFALSSSLTLCALTSGALMFALLAGQRRKALQLGHSLGQVNRAMQGNVHESLAGIKLAKILGTENRHLERLARDTGQLRALQLAFISSTNLAQAFLQFGGAIVLAIYLYLGLSVWQTPVPVLLTLVLIFGRMIPLLMAAHQQLHHWLHAMPALQEIDRLLKDCKVNAAPAALPELPVLQLTQFIRLDGVTVQYADRERPALSDVSLTIRARTTTAIMGASGAGKSTLADVLMGLLAPDSGTLSVDGMPLDGAARRTWRNHVAYVPQEVYLFHDSIRHNLLWGSPDASDDALRQALTRAAAEFVFQLPQGLDTIVGDGGVRLSGGERQRLALARALLQRPSLLILDEATSALDLANETRVREAIENLHGDTTVIIIGHRLPTLEHADQVVILEAGTIAAQGSWTEIHHLQHTAS